MEVKVTTSHYGDTPDTIRTYNSADRWSIDKGFLSVGTKDATVATFNDGEWSIVELIKETA